MFFVIYKTYYVSQLRRFNYILRTTITMQYVQIGYIFTKKCHKDYFYIKSS